MAGTASPLEISHPPFVSLKTLRSNPLVRRLVVLLLTLVPFAAMARLIHVYAVDTPFNDDWTFLEDWMKWKQGLLSVGDLFSAHMEHRVTVARALALLGHWIGGSDLRWQNAYTILLLLGMGWNLVAVLRRTSGRTFEQSWLPLLLMSAALFCSIQWQGLLWPILFEAYIPVFSLTLCLRIWLSELKPWPAMACSMLAVLAGMWSFGNGIISWVLVPALFWLCRADLSLRQRWQLTGVWFACAAVAGVLYSMNFGNAAPSQFSYGQGSEVTAGHSVMEFLRHLSGAPRFITALLGSHLSRGLHLDNLEVAEAAGWLSLAVFGIALVELWRGRKDAAWVRTLVPWLLLGLFSIGTAVLIAAGRLWLSKSGTLAITVRYVSHAIPLTVALIALMWIIGRRWAERSPALRLPGGVAVGALFMLLLSQWVYGAQHMRLWQESRLQGRALLLFAKLLPTADALGPVAADGAYCQKLALEMDKLDMMSPSLMDSLKLSRFKVIREDLPQQRARFDELLVKSDGTMLATGYSELPSGRPADLVLFTTRNGSSQETIFAMGVLESVPRYLYYSTKRDREFLAIPSYTPQWTARWLGPLTVFSVPKKDAEIDAWALDVDKMRVYRIADDRLQGSHRFPKGLFPNSDR